MTRRAELAALRAEHWRLVTVVFADLVDFTVLSRQLDAEDIREIVGTYFARWQRVIGWTTSTPTGSWAPPSPG